MGMLRRYGCILMLAASSCSSHRYLNTQLRLAETDFKNHIGFILYDPLSRKTLYDHQGDRFFTPASNTKIFTLYASLQLLGDSIPALRYVLRNDSLIFWGTGDPSFLYQNTVRTDKAYNFLKNHPGKLYFSSGNFQTKHFGPGWAWGDYNYSYQVERTPFPVYGNRSTLTKTGENFISRPGIFHSDVRISAETKERPELVRGINSNELMYFPGKTESPSEWEIPFHYSDDLLIKILTDTLKKAVQVISTKIAVGSEILYSVPADSLYKVMMQESDNFIAEQLLLVCANVESDTLKPEIAIKYMKKKFLFDLPDGPVWVDGSGLSRYNLFTPRSIVRLWEKIYAVIPRDRLFGILAVGGQSGTIKNYFKAEKPFIFGKTGTLSNNSSLSGYLVTKRGRTLIFSWMNNNFTVSSGEVHSRMETILKKIYEKY